MTNEFQHFVLSKVTGENIIVIVLEDLSIEVVSKWYIDSVVKEKEAERVS